MRFRLLSVALVVCALFASQGNAQFSVVMPDRDVAVQIVNRATVFTGASVAGEPGQPLLPMYKLSFILPPGVSPNDVSVSIVDPVEQTLDGSYIINPAMPLKGPDGYDWPAGKNIFGGKDVDIYGKNAFFPADNIGKVTFGKFRDYQIVDIAVYPFTYNPVTGQLKKITGGTLTVHLPQSAVAARQMKASFVPTTKLEGFAEKFLKSHAVNPMVMDEYSSASEDAKTLSINAASAPQAAAANLGGYAIITTQAIVNGSTQLQNLINQKTAAGYTVFKVTESTWGGGTGDVAAERIRSWLLNNYMTKNIVYVLLIGDPTPSTGAVPMKMLWPRTDATEDFDGPSDYYYAELTATNKWDVNNNGKFGETKGDFDQPNGPDVYPDVIVGRIPYYGVMTDLDKILAKSIAYANETSRGWRKSVLLPMKPLDKDVTSCLMGETVKTALFDPNQWRSYRIYDKFNTYSMRNIDLVPTLNPAIERVGCTQENVLDAWKQNRFGMVIWSTHGSANDATGIFNSSQAPSLNDKYPSMTFQVSCSNGSPEAIDNLGYSLLLNGAITTISGSRFTFYGDGVPVLNDNSNHSMGFSWAYYSINYRMTAGEALNVVRTTMFQPSWVHIVRLNLYGLPDLAINVDDGVPEELSARATSTNQIELTWTNTALDAAGYRIERATGSGSFSEIATVASNQISYYDNGLAANTKYRYRIRMYTTSSTSDYSLIDSTTTFGNIAPGKTITYSSQQSGNTAGNAIDGSTTTRWAASSSTMPQWYKVDLGVSRPLSGCEIMFERTGTSGDCNDFKVETSDDNTNWTMQVNRNPNTNTAQTQAYAFNATARYVRITISDAPGTYYASMYEFRIFGETVPSQPVWNMPVSVPEDQLQLSWQPSSGAATYTVYFRSMGGARHVLADRLTTTSYTATNLLGGKWYILSVAAFNAAGHSLNALGANEYWTYAAITPPVVCSYLSVKPLTYRPGYTLEWYCTSKNVTRFEITRAVLGTSNWTVIATPMYYERSYVDANTPVGTSYEYRIRAYNDGGYSPYLSANTNVPPAAPDEVQATYDGTNVSLTWTYGGSTGTGFRVQRMTDFSDWQTIATFATSVRSYVDANVPTNHNYGYQVCSYNAWGENCTSFSNSIYTKPAAPTNLTAAIGAVATTVVLNWTNNTSIADVICIERAKGSGSFEETARPKAGFTTYTDENLDASTTYRYRIRGLNPSYYSDYSNIATITTVLPGPAAPSNLVATANSRSQITLTWTDNSTNETGFYIERAPSGGSFTQIGSVGANVKTYVNNTGLAAGTLYQYRVRAYNGGGNSGFSNTASATTHGNLALSGTPSASSYQTGNVVANAKDNSTTTRWAASSGTMPQWWKVDLGGSKTLSEVEIMFERTGTSGDCNDFKVETSPDNTTWTVRVDKSANTNTAQTQAYTCSATARYVRITISDAPGTYYASIYEFRVFGK
jgi:hypothetical protein